MTSGAAGPSGCATGDLRTCPACEHVDLAGADLGWSADEMAQRRDDDRLGVARPGRDGVIDRCPQTIVERAVRSSLVRDSKPALAGPAAAAMTCAGVTNPACVVSTPTMRSRSRKCSPPRNDHRNKALSSRGRPRSRRPMPVHFPSLLVGATPTQFLMSAADRSTGILSAESPRFLSNRFAASPASREGTPARGIDTPDWYAPGCGNTPE